VAQIQNMRASSRPRLLARARGGDLAAQTELGQNYFIARPVRKRQAALWWRKAAHAGHAEAQYYLGLSYNGVVLRRNHKRMRTWLERAAAQEWPEALTMLAHVCAWGEGGPKDERRASRLYLRAAAVGDAYAMYSLGVAYRDGRGVRKNARRAFEWFRKAIEGGVVHAAEPAFALADRHGSALDRKKAARWLRRAARSGDASAQNDLGSRLSLGTGLRKNLREAVRWHRRAARRNDRWAWYDLGLHYQFGQGVRQSWPLAIKCFERAARLGVASAPLQLAECYAEKSSRTSDSRRAIHWLKKAAAKHDPEALYLLGIHYHNGSGVRRDHALSARLYRESAELGEAYAMYLLGLSHRDGEGVARSLPRARRWFTKAANADIDEERETVLEARKALAALEKRGG